MTDDEQRDGGVLAGLPASRPQRRSRRRGDEAAPGTESAPAAPSAEGAGAAKRSAPGTKAAGSAKRSSSPKGTASAKGTASQRGSASAKSAGPAKSAASRDRRIAQPGQPAGTPPQSSRGEPPRPGDEGGGVVETAVQAAGELAHIGLTAGGQFVRGVLSRLPRP